MTIEELHELTGKLIERGDGHREITIREVINPDRHGTRLARSELGEFYITDGRPVAIDARLLTL